MSHLCTAYDFKFCNLQDAFIRMVDWVSCVDGIFEHFYQASAGRRRPCRLRMFQNVPKTG